MRVDTRKHHMLAGVVRLWEERGWASAHSQPWVLISFALLFVTMAIGPHPNRPSLPSWAHIFGFSWSIFSCRSDYVIGLLTVDHGFWLVVSKGLWQLLVVKKDASQPVAGLAGSLKSSFIQLFSLNPLAPGPKWRKQMSSFQLEIVTTTQPLGIVKTLVYESCLDWLNK